MPILPLRRHEDVRSVAVIGTGSVGASWAALFLAHGLDVFAFDPSEGAEARARAFVSDAWPALIDLGIATEETAPQHRFRFVETPAEAARLSDVIQENAPEKPALKASLLAELDAAAAPTKPIISSTGGIPPSLLQASCRHPERFVVVHPFNPTHLIPLVEVIGGKDTAPEVMDWAMAFSRRLGKQPIRLNIEANGHMTNRLQFALVREAVACLLEGIASASDIDAAVRYGLGPRWTLMGSLLTLHLAGGPGGMKGILDHAGPAIQEWWAPSRDVVISDAVKARLVEAAAEVADGRSINDWITWRDSRLVDILKLQADGPNGHRSVAKPENQA